MTARVIKTVWLTPREMDVLVELVEDGADNITIGRRLYISHDTVKSHVKSMLKKSGMHNRTALALAVERRQVVVRTKVHGNIGRTGAKTWADTVNAR